MSDDFSDPHKNGGGLSSALPRWAWAAILGLFALAGGSLMVPDTVATDLGVAFETFFWVVVAIQGIAAFGIIAVLLYARPTENRG